MRIRNQELMDAILEYIDSKYVTESYIPSYTEIAEQVGISKSSAFRNVKYLEERGLLTITADGTILTRKMQKMNRTTKDLGVVGEIACGTPIFAEENIESYLSISASFLGAGDYFVLRAKGNSMINAGIEDGDYVIIRQQSTAEEGQIVVALIGDEATLKRYYVDKRRKKIRLHPENEEFEDQYYSEVVIQGVAVKVIKDLEV